MSWSTSNSILILAALSSFSAIFASSQDASFECFGMPLGCQCPSGCNISVQWRPNSSELYEVILSGLTEDYVGLGWPTDKAMSPTPVIMCSESLENRTRVYFNEHGDSVPAAAFSPDLTSSVSFQDINGTVTCRFLLSSKFNVTSQENTNMTVDLNSNNHHVILAAGPMGNGALSYHHDKRVVSEDIINWQKPGGPGVTGCFGTPINCTCSKDCNLWLEWEGVSENEYHVILGGNKSDGYLAAAWPTKAGMNEGPAIACSMELANNITINVNENFASTPTNNHTASIVSNLAMSVLDGYMTCQFDLLSKFDVSSPSTLYEIDLNTQGQFLAIASGSVHDNLIQYHDVREKTESKVFWADSNPFVTTTTQTSTESTGSTATTASTASTSTSVAPSDKHCFGIPDSCNCSQDCSIWVEWEGTSKLSYHVTLGSNQSDGYVALGWPKHSMNDGPVVACSLKLDKNFSINTNENWVSPEAANFTDSMVNLKTVSVKDGQLTCEFELLSQFNVSSSYALYQMDLNVDEEYLALAAGPVSDNKISQHVVRGKSENKFLWGVTNPYLNITTTATSTARTTSIPVNDDDIYKGCLDAKGCFGHPNGCLESKTCEIMATYSKADDGYNFEIGLRTSDDPVYGALGLSFDNKMGEDSVMACVNFKGKTDVAMYWNVKSGFNSEPLKEAHLGLSNISATYKDGFLKCSFQRNASLVIDSNDGSVLFDLDSGSYYLLMAHGSVDERDKIVKHATGDAVASSESVNLSEYGPVSVGKNWMVILHGALMMLAWLFTSHVGVYIARYCKNIFKGKRLFQKDAWFIVHQFTMLTTIGLSVAALIIIFIDKGVLPLTTTVPHAMVGLATVAAALVQPVMAVFRCAPTHEKRFLFNWSHRILGISVLILGYVSILLTFDFQVMPKYAEYIIYGVGAFILLFHLAAALLTVNSSGQFPFDIGNESRMRKAAVMFTIGVFSITAVLIGLLIFGDK